jgi:hypothetical protein
MRWGVSAVVAAVMAAALPAGTAHADMSAMPANAFVDGVGVNVHVMYLDTAYSQHERTIRALRWLGVRHVRDGVRSPVPGKTAWWRAEQRKRFLALNRTGRRLTLIAGGPATESLGSLTDRLRVVRGLRGVVAVEGPNEWDLSGDRDWARSLPEMQRALYAAVKRDPVLRRRGVRVLGPSLGREGNYAKLGDLSDTMDVGNIHAYTGARQPESAEVPGAFILAEGGLDLVRQTTGRRPLVVTETGYHDAFAQFGRQPPTAQRPAAAYQLRTLLQNASLGIRRTFVYELLDQRRDPAGLDQEANFGLFDHEFQPKPSARALRNLLRLLRDPGRSPADAKLDVTIEGDDDAVRSLLFAKSRGGYMLVLWRAVPLWDPWRRSETVVATQPLTVRLPRRFAVARAYRPVERATPTQVETNTARVDVPVGGDPVVIELQPTMTRPTKARGAPRPLVAALEPLRLPGGEVW